MTNKMNAQIYRPVQSQNEQTSLLQYHGSNIAFQEIDGKLMVNATQMARSFKKRPVEWLRTQQAQDLIKTVSEVHICTSADLQHIKKGGHNQGTWFQEDVALFFAQWLSPEFYLACNRKLKELITQQAIMLPAKYGVMPAIYNGAVYYSYKEVMAVLGGSVKYSCIKRKRRSPAHFKILFGQNFITSEYFDLLKGYYDYRYGDNQLKLVL
jgi:hypothetical protein